MRKLKLSLFWASRSLGLFRLARWMTRGQLKILCYHGFELKDECAFRPQLFIKPEQFDQRLAMLRRLGMRVAPLDEAVNQLYTGTLPANSVAITVDDGFHSTATLAAPLLKKHGCPATVYVTSYYVDRPFPVFRLLVQYMFFSSKQTELVLRNVRWSPDRVVSLSDRAAADEAMDACIDYGESKASEEERHAMCEELGHLLQTPYRDIVEARLFHLMTPPQLQALAGANVSVGLHTHRHGFSVDSRALAEREIADNRAALKRAGVDPIDHFCYPSGVFGPGQGEWLDEMGVKSSTTCLPGLNTNATPRHAMRRFLDGDNIHPLEFEAAVSGFSDLLRGLVQRA